jgi:hypothetical protein
MTSSRPTLASRALSRFSFRVVALQWGDNLFVILLAALWLQIPDSHAWQFAFSMLSAGALIIGFCWIQIATFARLRPAPQAANFWLRMLGFALVFILWYLLVQWISSGTDRIPDYAYLWNSKLSHGMRITFSTARLITGMTILLDVVIWAITALLLPIAITVSTEGLLRPSWKNARRPYRSILYWIAVFAFCLLTTQLTSAFISWQPGKTISGEVASVIIRLAIVWTTDILLWCLLLAFTAAWMERVSSPVIEIPAPS